MKKDWIDIALKLSREPADFYSGARKILRARSFEFTRIKDDLKMKDCGFTKSKMSMLVRNYLNLESHTVALDLWKKRVEQDKYGSVGLTTFNHYVKGNVSGASKRGSVFGPCIQSMTLTLLPKREVGVDVFYRTTELLKKFPADLVFIRDVLLKPFDVNPSVVTFHFANITMHPMYFVTLIPHLDDPIAELERIRKKDPKFAEWVIKWSARYVCNEYMHGIQKFAQAMRVRQDALDRIDKSTIKDLQKYFRKHHPGIRGIKEEANDDEE